MPLDLSKVDLNKYRGRRTESTLREETQEHSKGSPIAPEDPSQIKGSRNQPEQPPQPPSKTADRLKKQAQSQQQSVQQFAEMMASAMPTGKTVQRNGETCIEYDPDQWSKENIYD